MACAPLGSAIPYHHGLIRTSSDHFRYTPVYIHSHSDNLQPSPGQLPVNSRSTPVYLRLIPGRHPDYDRMTSGYHLFISVLFRLNVPVFSGSFCPLPDLSFTSVHFWTSTSLFLHSAKLSSSGPFTSSLPPLDSSGGLAETTSGTIGPSGLSAITSSVLRSNSPEFSGSIRLRFPEPDTMDDNGHGSGELPTK
ncbi:hypothetical protein K438DRAFT_1962915 [Mycena galopus ATCC 62051]|nr:hypothetical protein K438DRAFT_1962915 [Mycena galopus ATCC 62051]